MAGYGGEVNVPLVGVTAATAFDSRGFERASLNLSYLRALEVAGAVPLVLTPGMGREQLEAALGRCSGLVLSGGGDVEPGRYGQPPHESIIGVSEARDELEFAAIETAERAGLPVLAICRGMQVLNVALGGTLLQDISSMVEGALAHSVQEPCHGPAHGVEVAAGSRLAGIVGGGRVEVNSRHHQAVGRLGEGLVVTARTADGIIEAIEAPGARFVVGVQWHPEDMAGHPGIGESADRLFAAFVDAARSNG
ncbi:MAG: gamma-glutamyl-gamma-aminobutyrate hydrolase family protein [Chloroflexi bacterium]|nr:gamma-glutamyl-gamma-aminobutyrate hydrolase family protein [Chloroflexota bacterium]